MSARVAPGTAMPSSGRPNRRVGTLVIGAGPTGLGAAWRLREIGDDDWLLVEAGPVAGGASASAHDEEGFVWDLGGHVLHSHYDYFDDVLDKVVEDWSHPHRSGWVQLGERLVPTPIQQHLGHLAPEVGRAVVSELNDLADPSRQTDRNDLGEGVPRDLPAAAPDLGSWFGKTFGHTLTEAFFRPFNTKMWAHPPELLAHSWTSARSGSAAANVPTAQATLQRHEHPADVSTFPFPRGGTGSLWQAVADGFDPASIAYGTGVVRLDLASRVAELSDGTTVGFRECISTMPLPSLVRCIPDRPELTAAAAGLRYSAVHAVGFGFTGTPPPALAGASWVYSPDPDVPFHRATVLSNYSDLMAGPGRWSILVEAATSPHRPLDATRVVPDSLAVLRRWGVDADPVSVWQRQLPMGYPVPTLGRDDTLRPLQAELLASGVRSRGRFGGWRYESSNQDHGFMQGVEAVDAARFHTPETVYGLT